MIALQLLGGGILLLAGGEIMVKGAVAVATRLGVSKLLIGLTLVGFGTSTPELVASVNAALKDAPGLAIGNVVGSNIANVLLILAVTALVLPITTDARAFRRDGTAVIGSAVIFTLLAFTGTFGRFSGAALLLLLLLYTVYSYCMDTRKQDEGTQLHQAKADQIIPPAVGLPKSFALFLGGLAAIIFGADLLVDGATSLARAAGVSDTVIGLTVVAVGTSLPELITCVMAAWRGHSDVATGNIIGSNIFNIFGIVGVTALVKPIAVPPEILHFDIWVMLGATVLLVAFALTSSKIVRWEAAALLAAYAGYLAYQFLFIV